MTAMVRFRAGGTAYAVPVGNVRQVRPGDGVVHLPAARAGVAGLLRLDGAALPVLSVLGAGDERILVLEAGGGTFGLLVEDVSGVMDLDDGSLGPPPAGQAGALVTGVADMAGELVLVVDPAAITRATLG